MDGLPPPREGSVGDRSATRHQRDRRPTGGRRPVPRRRVKAPGLHDRPHQDRRRRAGAARRDRHRRSPARKTSSPTPTCGTSTPTSTARRPRSLRCADPRRTQSRSRQARRPALRRGEALLRSTATATGSSCTTRSPNNSAKSCRARSTPCKEVSQVQGVIAPHNPAEAGPPTPAPTAREESAKLFGAAGATAAASAPPAPGAGGRAPAAARRSAPHDVVPFRGEHQAGIVTPPGPDALLCVRRHHHKPRGTRSPAGSGPRWPSG